MECSPFYRSQSHILDFIPPRLHNWRCGNSWDKSKVPSSVSFRVGIPVFCDVGPTLNNNVMCWSVSPLSTLNCWCAVPCTLSFTGFTAELIVCLWFYCVFLQHLCNLYNLFTQPQPWFFYINFMKQNSTPLSQLLYCYS